MSQADCDELACALGMTTLDVTAKGLIEEVLSSYQTSLKLLMDQENGTTPKNVEFLLKSILDSTAPLDLKNALLVPENGLDNDTYNALQKLDDPLEIKAFIKQRIIELRHHPKIQSTAAEHIRVVCPYLRIVWEACAAQELLENKVKRRFFVSRVLKIIGAPHPDFEKHTGDLDALIDQPLYSLTG